MTGPQHYQRAERLLAKVESTSRTSVEGRDESDFLAAQAQVHATLALAAAAAYPAIRDYSGEEATEPREWARVTA